MDQELSTRILSAVDDLFEREIEFLSELTAHPSTRGQEQSAQALMASALNARGMAVDQWQIDVNEVVGCFASVRGADGEDEALKERPFLVRHKVSCQAGLHRRCQLESCPTPEGNPFCQHDLATPI